MNYELIEGFVNAVVYSNADNGYTVLRLETDDGLVTATGSMPGVSPGERLLLQGEWLTHHQYGQQFKAETFELTPPKTNEEIFRYLASGAVKHIGVVKAKDIVDKFGSSSLHVIENEPEALAKIKGISIKVARKISEDYRRAAGLRRLIDFLASYSIKPFIAMRVYKYYGDDAISAIRDNPYIIANELCGAQFHEADAVALDLGFESNSSERVSAAIIFVLTHNLNNGHVFIPRDKLIIATDQLINSGSDAIHDALDILHECGDIIIEDIAGVCGCYLNHMHEAESSTAKRLSEMASSIFSVNDLDNLIREIESAQNIKYAPEQRKALEIASQNTLMALTGGPGTGKTTTVRGILMLFDSLNFKTLLCAPTGRAAKRLTETCKREAATIHRMLGAKPSDDGAHYFNHDEENPLKADVVIVDETSMVDIMLMHSLISALPPGCRLILVGDADQLPSVGPGNVFADIIKSEVVPTIFLTEIFRQAEDSGIVKFAHSVNKGIIPDLSVNYTDLFFLRRLSEEQISETVAELYGRRLPENMGIEPSQIQVLSPTRKRASGTVSLNVRLREAVNPQGKKAEDTNPFPTKSDNQQATQKATAQTYPPKKEKQYGDYLFRVGDKVMQIKNNYDIIWKTPDGSMEGAGVFNGDIGTIIDLDHSQETITIDFEDRVINYLFEQLSELEPAFAMTVHKSQGSEYQAVILAMTSAAPQLLTRSILYTAVTRAKKLLVIVGNPDIMAKMIMNDKRQRRYSGLRARLAINN